MPLLSEELKQGLIGTIRDDPDLEFTEFADQYTPGALRTTYRIIMFDLGADLNDTGRLENPLEANQIPCEILKELEQLWQENTAQSCGWFGSKKDPYAETNCGALENQTLTIWIFSPPYNIAIDRLNTCYLPINES